MKVVSTLADLFDTRRDLPSPVGLVPTMGFLHPGHISLVKAARQDCASVVVTIFVNPTQFGPAEDLTSYPRNLTGDLALLETGGADLVWTPSPAEMYPPGFQTWVNVENLTLPLEGRLRPTHFKGVATVVAKLFNAVRPDKAYFGQKDAQQAAVLSRMSYDLSYPIEVVICPTVREADGLAMSSRNTYLDPAERKAAAVLNRSLEAARKVFDVGERQAPVLRQVITTILEKEPLAKIQYISIADPLTFTELENVTGRVLISMAVYIGKTRLIDNIILG